MGAGEEGMMHRAKAGGLTCADCPMGLVALPLTRLVVEVFIIAMLVLRQETGLDLGPALPVSCLPCSLPTLGIRDEQGMSSDEVLQDQVSVGATQAIAEQLGLTAQCLLGQPAHVSHCR